MTQYLKTVVTAVIAVSVITSLLPKDGFSKYINLLSSIIILAVLCIPILEFQPQITGFDVQELEIESNTYLQDEFARQLAEKIKAELKAKTNLNFQVEIYATTEEIHEIKIGPFSPEYAKIVADYVGIEEGKVREK